MAQALADGHEEADRPMTDDVLPSTSAADAAEDDGTGKPSGRGAKTSRRFIQAGDLIIVFLSRDRPPVPLTVTPGAELVNTYGSFPHDDMIGLPFGAKLASRNRRGFVHLLRPNPELWTLALPHRTQILYTPDMSFIAAHLGLSPGARLIEAGTGSGSFSHYATRCVARKHAQAHGIGWGGPATPIRDNGGRTRGRGRDGEENGAGRGIGDGDGDESEEEQEIKQPVDDREAGILQSLASEPDVSVGQRDGRVWSFEFHAGRAVKAWNEFEQHGLFPTLSLRHRNVVKAGFGLQDMADAVFLDLPAPWEALHHAARAMRRDVATRICCFSPCVEQVLKTVQALRKGQPANAEGDEQDVVRWTDIETYECLNRTHMSVWSGPGTLVTNAPIEEAIERIKDVEQKKGRRRLMQIERARKEREQRIREEEAAETGGEGGAEATQGGAGDHEMSAAPQNEEVEGETATEGGLKRKRDDDHSTKASSNSHPALPSSLAAMVQREGKVFRPATVLSRPFTEMRGHTSYLTFATLIPRVVSRQSDPTLEREKEAAQRKEQAQARAAQRKLAMAEGAASNADDATAASATTNGVATAASL